MKKYFKNLGSFFLRNEKRIVIGGGIIIIVLLSFTFGIMKGRGLSSEPLVINLPENPPIVINSSETLEVEKEKLTKVKEIENNCVYVGSKKGSKYYPPTCSYVKKVAPENLRCFASDEDAVAKGYSKSTSCK
jgi:hypothetical protein